MIVICKKATKKMVKGLRYEVLNLWNDGNSQRWQEGKIEILGFGRFVVGNFTDTDGKPIPQIKILNPIPRVKNLEFTDLAKGDIIVCMSDRYKTIAKESMYKIESLKEVVTAKIGWNKQSYNQTERTIKLEGIPRSMKFSSWVFRKLTPEESREINLNKILHNEDVKIITDSKTRKIDLVINKNLELMKNLSKSIVDENRHHLSILDWSCYKTGSTMGIVKEDYNDLMNMSLKDILELIETSKSK
jgi:hypothetical protein